MAELGPSIGRPSRGRYVGVTFRAGGYQPVKKPGKGMGVGVSQQEASSGGEAGVVHVTHGPMSGLCC